MKKQLFTAIMLLSVFFINAQRSAVSAGGEAAGKGGSASYSIGEIAYQSDFGESGSNLQGLQHAYEIFTVSERNTGTFPSARLSAYPNPTEDFVNIEFEDFGKAKCSFQLTTLTGKIVQNGTIEQHITPIIMKSYAAGIYLISIFQDEKPIKTFKIIKNQ